MSSRWLRRADARLGLRGLVVVSCLLAAQTLLAETHPIPLPGSGRKALMLGRGDPLREPGGAPTHPQSGKANFLRMVGNRANNPAQGWTCDLSWDVLVRLGLDPTNTSPEILFRYLGQHHLGYRIAMNNLAAGQTASYWGCAVDNGLMPFAPQYNNETGYRFNDPIGIRAAISVAGGTTANCTSYGPSVEFIDALPAEDLSLRRYDPAQSWANQVVAAKFARVLDAHPNYNIWDAREHLRQAASFWATGWTETNGYGRVNERAVVGKLLPGPPVEFLPTLCPNRHQVRFTWRNFLQTGFAATVIARKDGPILYEGTGTNFVWTSDVEGSAAFQYWSRNQAGEKSRMESYQTRTVTGLTCGPYQTCLVLGAPAGDDALIPNLCARFASLAPNWVCDKVVQPGTGSYSSVTSFPSGPVVGLLPDFTAMVGFALTNHYRLLVAPVTSQQGDLYALKPDWDRATAAGILAVVPHHAFRDLPRRPRARQLSPPRLFSAVTVGGGITTNRLSFGPGLECFDAPPGSVTSVDGRCNPNDAAAVVAAKLARILDANPHYNIWDARQHLRQSCSYYATGWVEDGGYGRPPAQPARIALLDPAPPIEIQAVKSADGHVVAFSWQNFLQSSFAATVILRNDGRELYHGAGTQFVWHSDVNGAETFRFFSRDKSGRLSRAESYTVLPVAGLAREP